MRGTFRPSFPTQTTQETGQRHNGAAAVILAVSLPRIDTRAHLKGGYLRRCCRRRIFVRQCSRVNLADYPLKTELPGVLKGLNCGASRGMACFVIRQVVYHTLDLRDVIFIN
jgi:hypothetical protein